MLYSNIHDFKAADYAAVVKALQLLNERNFEDTKDGRILIDDDTYIQVLSYETEDIAEVAFERHHHRLDIHYMVQGREVIYVSSQTAVRPISAYNAQRDIEFLEKPSHINQVILEKGDFLVIGMDEPHKTNGWVDGKPESVKKVVIKTKRKEGGNL